MAKMPRCWFNVFHVWGRWSKPQEDVGRRVYSQVDYLLGYTNDLGGSPVLVSEWRQQRVCERCGMVQYRTVEG